MLLEINDLSISYGRGVKPTVENVTFSLNRGEVVSIVGESGSGKTSVIRALLGVLPQSGYISKGKIIFDGKCINNLSKKEWLEFRGLNMAMIFQDSGNMLNPIKTIGKQFIEYIQTHKKINKKDAYALAVKMLKKTNLPDPDMIMKSYTFELSGGMRQRVGIAMAITFEPKLLLADEPTSALDVTTQVQIVEELLKNNKEAGSAMIMVTHNIGVASYISDKIIVMKDGKIVEMGSVSQIIHTPKEDYTKNLLNSVPVLGGKRYV